MRTWYRQDRPACHHCHYDLSGLPHVENCPECGERLDWEAAYQPNPRFVLVHVPDSDTVAADFLPTLRAPLRAIGWTCLIPGALFLISSLLFAKAPDRQLAFFVLGAALALVGLSAWLGAASGRSRVELSRDAISLTRWTWSGAHEVVFPRNEIEAFGPRKVGQYSGIDYESSPNDYWPVINFVVKHGGQHYVAARRLSEADAQTIMEFIRKHDPTGACGSRPPTATVREGR